MPQVEYRGMLLAVPDNDSEFAGYFEAAREQILRFGEEVVQPLHRKYPAIQHPAIPQACRW